MNLILLFEEDLVPGGLAVLRGRRLQHVREVHRAVPGDVLGVGMLGGRMGRGRVESLTAEELVLAVELDEAPPPASPVEILLGMPRPKILKKVLAAVASLGVKRLVLLNSARVEKSYFDSPLLAEEKLREHLLLGLEQGRDTTLPELLVRRRFKPFVEDELDGLWPAGCHRLVAHPVAESGIEGRALSGASKLVVAIGPEGGWIPYEVEQLERRGFGRFGLGPHILRVDTAVPYVVGQLELALRTAARGAAWRPGA